MTSCIFCRIIEGKAPAKFIHDDDEMVAIHDAHPQAPIHILVIPKKHVPTIEDASPELLGRLLALGAEIARQTGISKKGYRTVINCREYAGQSVDHLHVHVMGGRWFSWPPG